MFIHLAIENSLLRTVRGRTADPSQQVQVGFKMKLDLQVLRCVPPSLLGNADLGTR